MSEIGGWAMLGKLTFVDCDFHNPQPAWLGELGCVCVHFPKVNSPHIMGGMYACRLKHANAL